MDQAGEHLEGGGLAGAIGAQESHHFTGLDLEADIAHGRDIFVAPLQEMAQGAGKARVLGGDAVGLAEPVGANDRAGAGTGA